MTFFYFFQNQLALRRVLFPDYTEQGKHDHPPHRVSGSPLSVMR